MAKLTIDGRVIEVPDGTRLFDACEIARDGKALPHFCYHPDLTIAGVCRLCQVEVEGMPKLTIACNTIVRDDMVVHTRSEKVNQAVQQILEMHLINHPVDCPICDQAGECGLQDQYMDFGLYNAKVEINEKVNKAKAEVIGPYVILDQERCVLCSRCVRFCNEVTETGELGIYNRGDRAELKTAPGVELDNNYSLNTVDICPVGALTSRDFRFQKRVWMLKAASGVCAGCATGCNIRIDYEGDRIYRLKPRNNPDVNGSWMCDRGRMTYKAVHDDRRLTEPLRRSSGEVSPISWSEALAEAAGLLKPGKVALVLSSAHQSLEEQHLIKALGETLVGQDQLLAGVSDMDRAEGDNLLLDEDRTPNRRGAQIMGLTESTVANLAALLSESRGTVLIHGGNPAADPQIAAALKTCDRIIYLGQSLNETAQLAALVLPGVSWAEKPGLFVNRQGRLQSFQAAIVPMGQARQDWRILTDLMTGVGCPAVPLNLAELRAQLQEEICPGQDLCFDSLPERGLLLTPTHSDTVGGEV